MRVTRFIHERGAQPFASAKAAFGLPEAAVGALVPTGTPATIVEKLCAQISHAKQFSQVTQ